MRTRLDCYRNIPMSLPLRAISMKTILHNPGSLRPQKGKIPMRYTLTSAFTVAALAFLTLAACEKKSEPPPAAETPTTLAPAAASQGVAHAQRGVQPGTHEDWCGEHQVPESQCSRCNPSLVAAFKATGDWCEEHGLPESQCLICNPNLKIERPPRTEGTSP